MLQKQTGPFACEFGAPGIAWASIPAMPGSNLEGSPPQAKLGIYTVLQRLHRHSSIALRKGDGHDHEDAVPGDPFWTTLFPSAGWMVGALAMTLGKSVSR